MLCTAYIYVLLMLPSFNLTRHKEFTPPATHTSSFMLIYSTKHFLDTTINTIDITIDIFNLLLFRILKQINRSHRFIITQ